MSYFLLHLGNSVPSVITGTESKGTETEIPRFLVLKRTNGFCFSGTELLQEPRIGSILTECPGLYNGPHRVRQSEVMDRQHIVGRPSSSHYVLFTLCSVSSDVRASGRPPIRPDCLPQSYLGLLDLI